MPVYVPAQPIQQSALQPAPVDPKIKQLKDAKADVAKYAKRTKCTSMFFLMMGIMGVGTSVYCQFTAKRHAHDLVTGKSGHHGHNGHHGHHNRSHHGGQEEQGRHPHHPHHRPHPWVSREEFDLYDAVKTMSALSLMFFCKMMAMGKCGKKAAWGNSSKVTKKMAKLSLGAVMLMMVLSMFLSHEGKHIMEVSERA